MLTKIYFGLLVISMGLTSFFGAYAWSWLQSIGRPAEALAGYEYHISYAWLILWASALILLLLANGILWTSRKAWAMWITFAYVAIMLIIGYFFLDQMRFDFATANSLTEQRYSLNRYIAVILIFILAAITFFDQYIVSKFKNKTFSKPELTEATSTLSEQKEDVDQK